MQQIIEAFIARKEREDYFSDYVIKNSVRLFLLQCFSLALGFLSNYILIRFAGVGDYGSYIYLFNFLYLLVNFCILGMDTLLVKNIAIYEAARKYKELKGIVFFSLGGAILGSVIIAIISKGIITLAHIMQNTGGISWLVLSVSTLVMLSVTTLNQATLQGLKKITLSQVTEKIIRPLLIIVFPLLLFFAGEKIALEQLIWINIAILGISVVITFILYQKNVGLKLRDVKPVYNFPDWTRSALSFFLLGGLYTLNSRVDIFLLGLLRGNDEVGVYNIALKVSEVISFGLVIINFIIAPVIAMLFANSELPQLQRLVTQSAKMALAIGLPLMALIILFRKSILEFFGVNLFHGQEALLILCF